MDEQKNHKTDEEKLQDLEKKIEQLKAQKKSLELRASKKQRAERTRRLIQNGALSEKYLNCTDIAPDEFERLLQRLVKIEQVKDEITKIELD